jgi:hypothetical protein
MPTSGPPGSRFIPAITRLTVMLMLALALPVAAAATPTSDPASEGSLLVRLYHYNHVLYALTITGVMGLFGLIVSAISEAILSRLRRRR